jgi:hypothetical protein
MPERTRLHRLAEVLGLELSTVLRWRAAGLIRTEAPPRRGYGNATFLLRDQALELVALAMLRRHGVPLQRVRPVVRELLKSGKSGRDFLALGADGSTVLTDGKGDHLPLADPRTGQLQLFVTLDLRTLRTQAERLVKQLEREEQERMSARDANHHAAG